MVQLQFAEHVRLVEMDGEPSKLQWLLGAGVPAADFYEKHWERKPLVVKRGCRDYYGKLFDREELLSVLKAQKIDFGAGVTIAKHDPEKAKAAGARGDKDWHGELPPEEHPTGRATAGRLKELFASGHTAQVFATQKKSSQVRELCEALEAELLSLVGATAYLTPPKSQGIAPHHDDVEVIILQTQGSKAWQLFAPQRELSHKYEKTPPGSLGKPILEITLEQGDLLYIPRGVIHQARATTDFSTHLTISTYQAQSWGDLLEAAVPSAIEKAMDKDVAFRAGLPIRAFEKLGCAAVAGKQHATLRTEANAVVKDLLKKLADYVDVGGGVDAMHYEFMARRLPGDERAWDEADEGKCGEQEDDAGNDNGLGPLAVTDKQRVSLISPNQTAMLIREPDSDDEDNGEDEDEDEEEEEEEDDDDEEEKAITSVCLSSDGRILEEEGAGEEGAPAGSCRKRKGAAVGGSGSAADGGRMGGWADRGRRLLVVTSRYNKCAQVRPRGASSSPPPANLFGHGD